MKWFLKKLTGMAIVNFVFLIFAIMMIPFSKDENLRNLTSVISNVPNTSSSRIAKKTPSAMPTKDVLNELGRHNTKNDCWINYRGHVYNITPVFGTHPGGDIIILKYCGHDATSGFDTKDKSPEIPHSGDASNLLSQYLIQ